ncbi:hypothetical protein Mmc1_3377 [Magnetococcus marinus MC-1]|uniref:ABC-type transport auxiliary lipoprotein component domain-containing protein n=1 Tax=Magnetococcus marinus (strain ATCC BAA-1437 / JCM 17883 / MC-1) TaxID=156889 RepID=A0LD20_MAGMM|nr:PqiC family protein [Magnetococcus marinus]ABK45863.1 hypothetical protein Mmc1_3377 [Magnetococcus marinus MC-1]
MRILFGMIVLFVLSGCSTLASKTDVGGSHGGEGKLLLTSMVDGGVVPALDGVVVSLRPVEIPDYVDRSELVRRGGRGVIVTESPVWGESLNRGINRVTEINLAYLLGSARVVGDDSYRQFRGGFILKTQLFRLDAEGDFLVLEGRWHILRDRNQPPVLSRWYRHRESLEGDRSMGGQALAMSRALMAMNREQVRDIEGLLK